MRESLNEDAVVSDPRGAGACGDRSAPATVPRTKRGNPQRAIDGTSSRNRSALALSSEREFLQAPVFVSAPRVLSYTRGASSGSREPSRRRNSRVVSASRLRSRLPPHGGGAATNLSLPKIFRVMRSSTALHQQIASTRRPIRGVFVASPKSRAPSEKLQAATIVLALVGGAIVTATLSLPFIRIARWRPLKARFWQRGARRQNRTGNASLPKIGPLRRGPSAF